MEDIKCAGVHRDTFNENALNQIENVLRKKDTKPNEMIKRFRIAFKYVLL